MTPWNFDGDLAHGMALNQGEAVEATRPDWITRQRHFLRAGETAEQFPIWFVAVNAIWREWFQCRQRH